MEPSEEPAAGKKRNLIFLCYSRADNRNPDFCAMLERQLTAAKSVQENTFQLLFFVDTLIKPGVRWLDQLQDALSRTRVAVILEGPGLMGSEFVQKKEIPSFLKAEHERAGITIFRIPIRYVSKFLVPEDLAAFQTAWPLGEPLASLTGPERDAAMAQIIDKLIAAYLASLPNENP